MGSGVSEVATGNWLNKYDNADDPSAVVKESFRVHKIGVKSDAANDNKAAPVADNKSTAPEEPKVEAEVEKPAKKRKRALGRKG